MIISSYSAVSGISGISQLLFGLTTVYTAAGPQIGRFGYAAFGLTVLPYTIMSLVNTIATMVTPAYSCVYLVDSEIMEEAKLRGAVLSGVVGRLISDLTPTLTSNSHDDSSEEIGKLAWKVKGNVIHSSGIGRGRMPSGAEILPHDEENTSEQ